MNVIGYIENGAIRVIFDGEDTESIVPDDMGNSHRLMIAEWEAEGNIIPAYLPPPVIIADRDINTERDRRLAAGTIIDVADAGPVPIQGRDRDQTNMLGLKDAARDLRDAGVADAVMVFRDTNDVVHTFTPAQMIDMVSKGMAWFSATYQASWAIKAMQPIPDDYRDDKWWA